MHGTLESLDGSVYDIQTVCLYDSACEANSVAIFLQVEFVRVECYAYRGEVVAYYWHCPLDFPLVA